MRVIFVVCHPVAGAMRVYDAEQNAMLNCADDCTIKRFVEMSDADIELLGNAKTALAQHNATDLAQVLASVFERGIRMGIGRR